MYYFSIISICYVTTQEFTTTIITGGGQVMDSHTVIAYWPIGHSLLHKTELKVTMHQPVPFI